LSGGAETDRLTKAGCRLVACQPARFESLRSRASAWATRVCRSLKRDCHPSVERIRSEAPTICAARALLRWSAEDLARQSLVSVATIRRAELSEGSTSMTAANDLAVLRALEGAGVEFIGLRCSSDPEPLLLVSVPECTNPDAPAKAD